MTVQRIPSVIDVTASVTAPKVTTTSEPIRQQERFSADQVKDPVTLAEHLTRIAKSARDATRTARSSAIGAPTVYQGLAAGSGGALIRITHGLGRKVYYWPVGFVSAFGAPALITDPSTDANTLVIQSYVVGTLDLAVA